MAARTVTATARNANRDTQIRFYFGDAGASPPNAPRAEVTVSADIPGGLTETRSYDVAVANSSLSAANRTAVAAALRTLFDEAVAALGYT